MRRRIIDWVLTGLLLLIPALVLRSSLSRGEPSAVDETVLRITAPLQTFVSWITDGVGSVWSGYVALIDVESENKELREDNEKLRRELATMSRKAYDVQALEDLALYTGQSYNLALEGRPERLVGLRATPPPFTTLRAQPALGRAYTDAEAVPGADQVAVLSHATWQAQFAADPAAALKALSSGATYAPA